MRNTVYILAFAILGTALVLLMLFGDSGPIAGIEPDRFGRLAQLTALALVIGAGLVATRGRLSPKLWHVAVWLALLAALMFGYQAFGPGF
jgi:aspartyl protease family protein